MSVEQLTAAFRDERTTGSERLVLLALANISDQNGRSWPSQKYLARAAGLSDRTIRRTLEKLEELGLVVVIARTRENGSRTSNLHQLLLATPPDNLSTPPGHSCVHPPRTPVSTPYTSVEPSEETTERALVGEDGFEEWWEVYPRKIGKLKVEKLWQRLRKSGALPPTEEVVAATLHACRSSSWREDPKFIPHPTTWLERGGWADREPIYREIMGYDGELHRVLDTDA